MQDRVPEVDKTVPTRSGGSQADPERIFGSQENRKWFQNSTFEDRRALWTPKKAKKEPSKLNEKLIEKRVPVEEEIPAKTQ